MKTNNLLMDTATSQENSKMIRIDSIFLQENINRFSEQFFRKITQSFSRYRIERLWMSMNKTDADLKNQLNKRTKYEISYWKYPARKLHKAVSEPSLQKVWLLGTAVLQKTNSFHDLLNFNRKSKLTIERFGPKLVTWLYVTKAQCRSISFTKTDQDLLNIFSDDVYKWETSYESKIMCRLFADTAKYCKKSQFTDEKMSALLGIYYYTHLYNKSLNELSFDEVYRFFRELIIQHSVLMPPDHVNLFSTEEAKNIIANFLNKYLICLPLIRNICVPNPELHVQRKRNDSNGHV